MDGTSDAFCTDRHAGVFLGSDKGSIFLLKRGVMRLGRSCRVLASRQSFLCYAFNPISNCSSDIGMSARRARSRCSRAPEHRVVFPIPISHCEKGLIK